MHHYGSCILGIAGLDLLQEFQHPDGGEGHPEVGPAGEVELGHQALRLLVRDITHLEGKCALRLMRNIQVFPSFPKMKRERELQTRDGAGWLKKQHPQLKGHGLRLWEKSASKNMTF